MSFITNIFFIVLKHKFLAQMFERKHFDINTIKA